jgi:hypothetical protein
MNIITVSKTDHQRTTISLIGDAFSVEVRYEPLQHSVRVSHAGVQRLFFYEPDDFFPSKAALLNEYGLVVGKLQMRHGAKGMLHFDDAHISFVHNTEQSSVVIDHPAFPEGLQWNYAALQQEPVAGQPDLFRALLMILTWSVNVATLQV